MKIESLEQAIGSAPGVEDCGVVAERDETGRERFRALIVRRPNWNHGQFVAHCERLIERDSLPYTVVAVAKIPRDGNNHIDRAALTRIGLPQASRNANEIAALMRDAGRLEQQGQLSEALARYRSLLASEPGRKEIVPHIGRLLLRLGCPQDAVHVLSEALEHFPNSPQILTERGIALAMLGKVSEAIPEFRAALDKDPNSAFALFNLGRALVNTQKFAEAKSVLEKAVRVRADAADAHSALGEVVAILEGPADAIPHYARALELAPRHREARFNLGVALQDLNEPGRALDEFKAVIAIDPHFARAYRAAGIALQTLGRDGEARAPLERALELAPRSGRHLRDLAETLSGSQLDAMVARIAQTLSERPANAVEDRVLMLAALSDAAQKNGKDGEAFRYARDANAIARAAESYAEAAEFAAFDEIERTYSIAWMTRMRAAGHTSPKPIFVIGMPRSGSTLVEQILASHSGVHGAGEVNHLRASVMRRAGGSGGNAKFFERLLSLTPAELTEIGADYVQRLDTLSPLAHVTTKNLVDFQRVPLIRAMLPNAKIVHIVRDAVDTCISRYMSVFYPGNPYAFDLAELGRYHRRYERMMDRWREILPARSFYEVRYEDLVANPEEEIRKLLDYCGLEWEESCLAFHRSGRAVSTPTRAQVRQPAYLSSVGRWRRYQEHLAPLLDALERDKSGNLVGR